jgi:hypothetical protein
VAQSPNLPLSSSSYFAIPTGLLPTELYIDSPILLNGRGIVDIVDGWAHMSGQLTVENGWKLNGMTLRAKKFKCMAHRCERTF